MKTEFKHREIPKIYMQITGLVIMTVVLVSACVCVIFYARHVRAIENQVVVMSAITDSYLQGRIRFLSASGFSREEIYQHIYHAPDALPEKQSP